MKQITVRRLFTNDQTFENKCIKIDKGKIIEITESTHSPDYDCICAAFLDTHINGGKDLYFSRECNSEAIEDIYKTSVETGTYYVLPALITSSQQNILKGIEAMKIFQKKFPTSGVLGIHLEGPYIHPDKRGAHLLKYIRKPTYKELNEIIASGHQQIKIWTLAPEQFLPDQIEMILKAGIRVSFGHSNATYEQAQSGFKQGVNLVTHLFNAMSGLHHRKPGLVGAALAHEGVWCPVIPDGSHVHFGTIRTAFQAKPKHLFLISDALFLGREKQSFTWEEFDIKLINGKYLNSEGNLAGSTISIFEGIQNIVKAAGISLQTAVSMATDRPAKSIAMECQIGQISKGYPAVFSVFDENLKECKVVKFT